MADNDHQVTRWPVGRWKTNDDQGQHPLPTPSTPTCADYHRCVTPLLWLVKSVEKIVTESPSIQQNRLWQPQAWKIDQNQSLLIVITQRVDCNGLAQPVTINSKLILSIYIIINSSSKNNTIINYLQLMYTILVSDLSISSLSIINSTISITQNLLSKNNTIINYLQLINTYFYLIY